MQKIFKKVFKEYINAGIASYPRTYIQKRYETIKRWFKIKFMSDEELEHFIGILKDRLGKK